MSLEDDSVAWWAPFAEYTDAFYMLAPHKCRSDEAPASGNGLLYTSEAIVIARLYGMLSWQYGHNFLTLLADCSVEPGLLKRAPRNQNDQEGPDDYIGVAAACYAIGDTQFPKAWLNYGWRHLGVYNNVIPGRLTGSAFLWRMPQLIAHYKWAANERPCLMLRIVWATVIAISGWRKPKTDTDSRILAWLMIETMDRRCTISEWASSVFKKRLMRDYPNGMQDVAKIYFGNDHPLALAWPKY